MPDKQSLSQRIKTLALEFGFEACGICRAEEVDGAHSLHLKGWLERGYQAGMGYMENHQEKRVDPTLLVEGAKSIICLALNYYPAVKQPADVPQFAYYAYGKDYHDVMKDRLAKLFDAIKEEIPSLKGRIFCDTAPLLERYWAAKSGIGFIGKNSLLIIPNKGSFFFLGELVLNIELETDDPLKLSCGTCRKCLEACPSKAITKPYVIDSKKCISYQTIENKDEIDRSILPYLHNRLYGCDICQVVCPWNKFATPHNVKQFNPSDCFITLTYNKIANMTQEEYRLIFKGSAVKRAKYEGLKRNIEALKQVKPIIKNA